MNATNHIGYVITEQDTIYAQVPSSNGHGFAIADDDQTWPGGIGIGSWEAIADDDARITTEDRERLGWIIEEARA